MSTTTADLAEKRPLLKNAPHPRSNYTLVIHGGSGKMSKARCTPEQYAEYTKALRAALHAGYAVLRDGGEAMDAAVAAVSSMEGVEHII
jgi:beta-aspartyl-peptidase (threonine type)